MTRPSYGYIPAAGGGGGGGAVSTVAGRTGDVVLAVADVSGAAPKYATQSKTASFTAAAGFAYLVDTTAGTVVATLPAANSAGQQVAIKRSAGANLVTVQRAGTDTIGTATISADITLDSEVWEFTSSGAGQWNMTAGNKSLASLDARYALTGDTRIVGAAQKASNLSDLASASTARTNLGLGTAAVAPVVDVQTFTTSGTWTKPAGAKLVTALVVSGGGGGGSGRRGAVASVRCGGGGGAAGGITFVSVPASTLGATVTVTVGTGGAGGAAITTDDTDGANGVNGGASSFSANIRAGTGATTRGSGGTSASGVGGNGSYGNQSGAAAGSGGTASSTGGIGVAGANAISTSGGGSGGGITVANAASAGGTSGLGSTVTTAQATGGVVDSTVPSTPFAAASGSGLPGQGGGGGASSITTAAQAGATAGIYGCGGGGGGASLNGNASGAGGAGSDGIIIVTTYF